MTNPLQILRTTRGAARPVGRLPGEIWVNFADGVFGYIDASGNAVAVATTATAALADEIAALRAEVAALKARIAE